MEIWGWIALGVAVPFLGTVIGAAAVFFCRDGFGKRTGAILNGTAAGVMTASAVFSLLLPAVEGAAAWGKFSFFPAVLGLLLGAGGIAVGNRLVEKEGRKTAALAVTLHNLPEGLAVGVLLAALAEGAEGVTVAGAMATAAGIALQNVPEGAIVSLPAYAGGHPRWRAFLFGSGSGAVEPPAALLALVLSRQVAVLLPWLLGLAAGAMLYVVASELLSEKEEPLCGIAFSLGFALMMTLDLAFG